MKFYLVGGAVRDRLLGLAVKDRDWVVVGATAQQLAAQGYRPVGRDFPVFLHPQTREEYALARTERKSGRGHGGFVFYAAADVTLEEDLQRRDLTINAMAEDIHGRIIDPCNGQQDLHNRLLRHVSPAFIEDPLRVLRVARFAARLTHAGFTIATETMVLMGQMSAEGELDSLSPERIWQETAKALGEPDPATYFRTLIDCGALHALLPSWQRLFQENPDALAALALAADAGAPLPVRFACLFPPTEPVSADQLKAVCQRMRCPRAFAEPALLVNRHYPQLCALVRQPTAEGVLALFEQTDALRKPERFEVVLASCQQLAQVNATSASVNGGPGTEQWQQLTDLLENCRAVDAGPIVAQGYTGRAIGKQLRQVRLHRLEQQLQQGQ